ncbi:MAG: sirohydrochlorin chelatase [Nostocaceae cyanobacterium]|nr:sirohydrochlorin chelatase [Nostocaceae cyanobacterium]
MPTAYLLVSHGSRDPRPEIAMQQLAEMVWKKIPKNLTHKNHQQAITNVGVASPPFHDTLLGTAYLELNPQPLHAQISQFAQLTSQRWCYNAKNYLHLKILPLFLLPGVHVMEDIPAEVAQAQQNLGKDIILELQPYIGSHPGLQRLLKQQFTTPNTARIILAHGSRRPHANTQIEALATSLNAVTAYWSLQPSLETRVQELVTAGYREITIAPYFLFPGGITDAIANSTEALKLRFPGVSFHLAAPLGTNVELADLIWDLTQI